MISTPELKKLSDELGEWIAEKNITLADEMALLGGTLATSIVTRLPPEVGREVSQKIGEMFRTTTEIGYRIIHELQQSPKSN